MSEQRRAALEAEREQLQNSFGRGSFHDGRIRERLAYIESQLEGLDPASLRSLEPSVNGPEAVVQAALALRDDADMRDALEAMDEEADAELPSALRSETEPLREEAEAIRALGRWTGTLDGKRGAKIWVDGRPMFAVIAGLSDSKVSDTEPQSRWRRCFSLVIDLMNSAPDLLAEVERLRVDLALSRERHAADASDLEQVRVTARDESKRAHEAEVSLDALRPEVESLREKCNSLSSQLDASYPRKQALADAQAMRGRNARLQAEAEGLRSLYASEIDRANRIAEQLDALADALLRYTTGDDCGCCDGSPDQPRSVVCVYCSGIAALQKAGRL